MMADRERRLTDIEGRIASTEHAPAAIDLETRRMEKEAQARLADLRGLLSRSPDQGHKVLESLIDGPLTFTPTETAEGKRYEVSGKIAVGGLFTTEGVPSGIRTRVPGMKTLCPGPD